MRKTLIVATACLIAVVGVGSVYARSQPKASYTAPKKPVSTSVAVKPVTSADLLALVNAERAKNGVAPLTEDSRLDTSAQEKAVDEATYNYFGHVSPHTGKNSHDWIFGTGISCADSSENLTENIYTNDAKSAVEAWIASPPHHQAMISPLYTLTGFGISGNQIVEHFCQQ